MGSPERNAHRGRDGRLYSPNDEDRTRRRPHDATRSDPRRRRSRSPMPPRTPSPEDKAFRRRRPSPENVYLRRSRDDSPYPYDDNTRRHDATSNTRRRRRPASPMPRRTPSPEHEDVRRRSRSRGPRQGGVDPEARPSERRRPPPPLEEPRSRSRSPREDRPSRRDRRKRRRRHSPDSNDEDARRHHRDSSRRRGRGRRRGDRRQRSSSQHSPPPRGRRSLSHPPPRAGIVSEDDDLQVDNTNNSSSKSHHKRKLADSPRSSVHDDTVGHFEGERGTIIAERYRVLEEVGRGTFGRVLECLDMQRSRRNRELDRHRSEDKYCAIKIVRKVKRYYESALIEAKIARDVNRKGGRGVTHCVVLHDAFTFQGHYCMVFESLGPSLYDFLKRHDYQPFPMVCVQDFAVQLLETMEFLHSSRIIHTDLKIENILLVNAREIKFDRRTTVPERTKIKLIDFGGACYDDSKKSSVINTRQYRAPEVILGTGWSMPADMWSLGCILAELYQGELLFPTHSNLEHLALMERVIGAFPRRMLKDANQVGDEGFDASGRHRMERVLSAENLSFVRKATTLEELVRHPEDRWFLGLLRQIMAIDPAERATAHESLAYLNRMRRCFVRYA